jgi:hypothetical protein
MSQHFKKVTYDLNQKSFGPLSRFILSWTLFVEPKRPESLSFIILEKKSSASFPGQLRWTLNPCLFHTQILVGT